MSDGLSDGEPPAIDPYEVLGLNRTASADQVKTAYRKAALKWHPDKVAARHSGEDADTVSAKKTEAHTRFQEVALAYAVLSDAARRKRYDETGSTAESVVDADGFSWSDFYRAAFADAVSADAIEKFAAAYKGSAEERTDLLSAYTANKGRMDGVYEGVMLSNVLEDDARFRSIIDAAVATGEVQAYAAYRRETASTRRARAAAAKREASEAEEYARELGVHEKLFGVKGDREGEDEETSEETAKGNGDKSKGKGKGKAKGGKGGKDDIDTGLAALIQQRQKHRAASFLDNLATKFGAVPPPGSTKSKNKAKRGKKRLSPSGDDIDDNNDNGEPSEEAFQAAAARLKNGTKKARR